MKWRLILLICCAPVMFQSAFHAHAQEIPIWTWYTGEMQSPTTEKGHFGTRGIPSIDNYPPLLNLPNLVADTQGRLWLFGGEGILGIDTRNNLWRFDPDTGAWAWMTGFNARNNIGNYGVLGEETPGATPGARRSSAGWTDDRGRIWIFGGNGYTTSSIYNGFLGDTWRYDPSTGNWAWIKGGTELSSQGVFGTMGIESPEGTPPARIYATTWGQCSEHVWLFGGVNNETSHLDDLWRLDTKSQQWTWMKGSQQPNQPPVWGQKGVEAPDNTPGSRYWAAGWTDPAGRLWLYGGERGLNPSHSEIMSDLWRFDPATGNWAWISGPQEPNQLAHFATMGVADPLADPGCREGAVGWTDRWGRLLLFSGQTYAPDTDLSTPAGDDLWRFDPATGYWTWLRGGHNSIHYGMRGLGDPANTPGTTGRNNGACSDPLGRMWVHHRTSFWLLDQPAYTGKNAVAHGAWSDLP